MQINTHLNHTSHYKTASGTNWSNRWTYRVHIRSTRRDSIHTGGSASHLPQGYLAQKKQRFPRTLQYRLCLGPYGGPRGGCRFLWARYPCTSVRLNLSIYIYVSIYPYISISLYMYLYMYVCMYVCIYLFIYLSIYLSVYIYIYIFIHIYKY